MIKVLINEMKLRGMNKCVKICYRGWEFDFFNIILIYFFIFSNVLDWYVCYFLFKWKKINKLFMLYIFIFRYRVVKEKVI